MDMNTILWKAIIVIASLVFGFYIGHPEFILVGLTVSFLPMIITDLRNNPGKNHSSHDDDGYDIRTAGVPIYGPETNNIPAQQHSHLREGHRRSADASDDWLYTVIIMEFMRDDDSLRSQSDNDLGCSINPVNGLPMINYFGGIDIEDNLYGTDSHDSFETTSLDDSLISNGFDDDFGLSSFDDSFSSGSDSGFNDDW